MVKRRQSKNNQRHGVVRRFFVPLTYLLWRRLTLKILLMLSVLLAVYVAYLDATIRSSFEGKKWQLPARVYARPLELYQGLALGASELEAELKSLGYLQRNATVAGSYFRNENQITLYSRGYRFWDGEEREVQVHIIFDENRIVSMRDLRGEDTALVRLEPLEIGAIYPQHKEDRILVKVEDVPPLLTAALLAVEDHRYYDHRGLAPSAIARAALQNLKSGGVVQGGSTITQQLVKNYYLNHQRTLRRKVTEAIMSLLLELHYDKEQILQAYLNEVYLGQTGDRAIHGFGLASQHYFNRPLAELSVEKLALLVAIVRGPAYYDPWRNPDRAIARRNLVLDMLVAHRLLDEKDASWSKSQPLNLGKASRSHFVFPAYMDLVKRQLATVYSADDLVSNGLKIYTSFDPRIQRAAENALADWLLRSGDSALEGAVVVTHPATGEVLALVGGRRSRFAGFNRALDARRSVGSVIKPFVYIPALDQPERYSLATPIDDAPVSIEMEDGSIWSPRNFDRQSHGEVPLVTALARSYNQATARLGQEQGVEQVVETMRVFGLERQVRALPSLFIGTTQLTPLEVASLYQTISAGGYRVPPKAIRSVLDNQNQPLERFPFDVQKVMNEKTNFIAQHGLINVGTIGSARYAVNKLGPDRTFAGKTGTSGGQRDSWFAGYTGDMLAVVWVGHDDNRQTPFTGSSAALRVWTELIASTSRQSLQLIEPDNIVFSWVDFNTGQRAKQSCASAIKLPFVAGSEPAGVRGCSDPVF